MTSRAITSTVEISAPREAVWAVLVAVARYPEWNPFTIEVATTFAIGAPVRMRVALLPRLVIRQTEVISSYDEGRSFSWGVTMLGPWFLQADRTQVLEDLPGGRTRYTTTDTFTGRGAPLNHLLTGRLVQRGFDGVASGLKRRCEPPRAAS